MEHLLLQNMIQEEVVKLFLPLRLIYGDFLISFIVVNRLVTICVHNAHVPKRISNTQHRSPNAHARYMTVHVASNYNLLCRSARTLQSVHCLYVESVRVILEIAGYILRKITQQEHYLLSLRLQRWANTKQSYSPGGIRARPTLMRTAVRKHL